jgi:transcriptional regulator with XRE-family HTH domain
VEDPDAVLAWSIAQRVRRLRIERGLRQEDLAARCDIARPNIVRLERGRHLPTLSTLRRVSAALEVDLPDLLVAPVVASEAEDGLLAETDLETWARQLEAEDRRR